MSDPNPLRAADYQPQPPAVAPLDPSGPGSGRKKTILRYALPVLLIVVLGAAALLINASQDTPPEPVAEPAYVYTPNPAIASLLNENKERDAEKERTSAAIGAAMSTQSAALLAGDRATFVGFAEPSAGRVTSWLSDRFTSLRAMGVAQWSTSVTSARPDTGLRWQANVDVKYCFVKGCAWPLTATLHTTWNMAGQTDPRIVEMYEHTPGQISPPWAQSVLEARVGSRVVVAATRANAGRLDSTLAAAETAARTADGLASAAKPGRYVVYLAGAKEWARWPYGDEGKWVAGYANEKSESVVLKLSALGTTKLDVLLRHELAHVASLAGRSTTGKRADSWWLVEGLAEYAAIGDKPFPSHPRRAETAAFVRSKWKGDLRVGEPGTKASARDASGRYGTAHLAVSCLMQKYGRTRTLGFFDAVAVRGTSPAAAADRTLGKSWSTVSGTCVAQVRRTAR